jgi:ribonuclease J
MESKQKGIFHIYTIGGYSEIGRNMTALKYKDEVVIFDMGVHLESYIKYKSDDDLELYSKKELINVGAIPDDKILNELKNNVIAIIPSHGHLDHIGAIPFSAEYYDAPVICSPYTASVIKAILKDKNKVIDNEIVTLRLNKKLKLSQNITIELINVTHSIPDTALVVVHTPDGSVMYANDFKLDDNPTFQSKPNYKRLKNLGQGKLKALIVDSLYAYKEGHTPSESVAKEKLRETLLNIDSKNRAIVITTFSSHIARLKSIIELGKRLRRKILFMGRSLGKYVYAAQDIGLFDFASKVDICNYTKQMGRRFLDVQKNRGKYIVVCTGHQGEPQAILSRIVEGSFPFKLQENDHVIFSSSIIPSEINIANRASLDKKLTDIGVNIYTNIHASGHAWRDDHEKFIKMLNPKHVIPAHGPYEKTKHMKDLCVNKLNYDENNVHLMENGQILNIE